MSAAFSFDFNADPALLARELNAPRPCNHGVKCYNGGKFNSGCAFVHPGEEGVGMRLFPARTMTDPATGKETWQKATVRLFGSPEHPCGFYERRRLKMSWPQWCAMPKNAHLKGPAITFASVAFSSEAPNIFLTSSGSSSAERLAAIAALPLSAKAIALNNEAIAGLLAIQKEDAAAAQREAFGVKLMSVLTPFLNEQKAALTEAKLWCPTITAGKITGMLLEGLDADELNEIIAGGMVGRLGELTADACQALKDAYDCRVLA